MEEELVEELGLQLRAAAVVVGAAAVAAVVVAAAVGRLQPHARRTRGGRRLCRQITLATAAQPMVGAAQNLAVAQAVVVGRLVPGASRQGRASHHAEE